MAVETSPSDGAMRTRTIGLYIRPMVDVSRVPRWRRPWAWLRVLFRIAAHCVRHGGLRYLVDPHPGFPCAQECYRVLVEINGRRQFAWRHHRR